MLEQTRGTPFSSHFISSSAHGTQRQRVVPWHKYMYHRTLTKSHAPRVHAALHEDLERLERVIVKDYAQETRTYKEKLMQNHRVRRRLDTMQEAARKLVGRAWGQGRGAMRTSTCTWSMQQHCWRVRLVA